MCLGLTGAGLAHKVVRQMSEVFMSSASTGRVRPGLLPQSQIGATVPTLRCSATEGARQPGRPQESAFSSGNAKGKLGGGLPQMSPQYPKRMVSRLDRETLAASSWVLK